MDSILLHICCAPCSTHVLKILSKEAKVTCCFYNPNIYPEEEYKKRLKEAEKFAGIAGTDFLAPEYDTLRWQEAVKGLEREPEGGRRCAVCYRLRLESVAELAAGRKDDFFGTTLTISPHKDAVLINALGEEISRKYGVRFYNADFKKKEGFKIACRLAKEHGLYRQSYCGCQYSVRGLSHDLR